MSHSKGGNPTLLRYERLLAIMAAVNLPSPIGLLQEKGVIGQVLRQLQQSAETVLSEAEPQDDPWTWLAEWVQKNPVVHCSVGTMEMAESECIGLQKAGFSRVAPGVYSTDPATRGSADIYQGVREVRFYYHNFDPEKIVMRLEMGGCWPDSFRRTFEAAASQRQAMLRLVEIGRGGGSISQSWRLKLVEAESRGDERAADHWANKVAASVLQYEKGRQWLLEDRVDGLSAPPEMREESRRRYEMFYEKDVRKFGRKKADEKWKGADNGKPPFEFKRDTIGEKIATALALGWLSNGNGFPGFCFISDKVLATMLGLTLPLRSLLPTNGDVDNQSGRKTIEDCRRDIGLTKAETLVTGLRNTDGNVWALLDENGKDVAYFNQTPPLPPKLAG